jgi:hypothetical protein
MTDAEKLDKAAEEYAERLARDGRNQPCHINAFKAGAAWQDANPSEEEIKLCGLVSQAGDWVPGNGLNNDFMDGSRASKMQNLMIEIYRTGWAVFEKRSGR